MNLDQINNVLQTHYGFTADNFKKLYGYLNENYRVDTVTKHFILKTFPYSSQVEIDCQAESEKS